MKHVPGLLTITLTLLMGSASGLEPSNGYCIGSECFAVFQGPSDFTAAQTECADKKGHLMTVRSSVSHDTFSILLGSLSERFWIGLHLPSGCPDASAKLRGFQWVTGDSESDYYNWAPTFDSSCSPQCVSVSRGDNFTWATEPCDQPAAGYLCEFSFHKPCKRLEVTGGESVTYTTPYGFEGEDLLSLPPGSTAIRRPAETKYICFNEQWLKAPWSCEIIEGGCEYKCAADHQEPPSCFCPPGQEVNPQNNVTCEVAKKDPCLSLGCEQICQKEGDIYECKCEQGFELAADGRTCRDFNDCRDERQCPGDNFKCINTVGGFQCVCKDGYRLTGDQCVDMDECVSAPCEHHCTNSPGSYNCSCFDGYIVIPETPHKCKLHCGKAECPAECDPNNPYQCDCPDGYILEERQDEMVCLDFNECEMFYCEQGCENTYGGYVCSCNAGYKLVDQFKCRKTDGDTDKDTDGWEGSGAATTPYFFTTPSVKYPEPTRRPSKVTAGGLLGIIVCIVVVILVLVFVVHHILRRRGKMESAGALKARRDEAHDLQQVTTNKNEKAASERPLKQDA
ncbi:thrombomodulin [Myripristis murdjan]|uniref:thrombomodulin n=1 Tax=Myripristis murdjan TaxID=586833 RepID=UPI001175ED00|nr:thrombomodulin-like [Myripristis murdjan]